MNLYRIEYVSGTGEPGGDVTIWAPNVNEGISLFQKVCPGKVATSMEIIDTDRAPYDLRKERPTYRNNIMALIDRQRAKGLKKYGQTLEDNVTLSNLQRIEHAQEELVDALQYLEHLKQTQADRMTVADYERSALRTVNPENADKFLGWGNMLDGVLGLTGEAGEVADVVKKALFQGHELDEEHLAEELGDVAWYLVLCCHAVGLSLEHVLKKNIDKLQKRYPEGFDKARSINREEVAEA